MNYFPETSDLKFDVKVLTQISFIIVISYLIESESINSKSKSIFTVMRRCMLKYQICFSRKSYVLALSFNDCFWVNDMVNLRITKKLLRLFFYFVLLKGIKLPG